MVTIVGNANPDDKVRALTTADILAEMSYFLNLAEGIGKVDDIDHLGNRRIRAVGELLANNSVLVWLVWNVTCVNVCQFKITKS